MDEYNGPGNLEIGTGESERERANSILSAGQTDGDDEVSKIFNTENMGYFENVGLPNGNAQKRGSLRGREDSPRVPLTEASPSCLTSPTSINSCFYQSCDTEGDDGGCMESDDIDSTHDVRRREGYDLNQAIRQGKGLNSEIPGGSRKRIRRMRKTSTAIGGSGYHSSSSQLPSPTGEFEQHDNFNDSNQSLFPYSRPNKLGKELTQRFNQISSGGTKLQILDQPSDQHRARYSSEGSRGAVKDASGEGSPKIQLVGYNSSPVDVIIYVANEKGSIKPHVFFRACKIASRNSTPCEEISFENTKAIKIKLYPKDDMIGLVDCVGILKLRNADVENKWKSNSQQLQPKPKESLFATRKNPVVRLAFRAEVPKDDGEFEVVEEVSAPIRCSQPEGQPEILKISSLSGSPEGGDEIIVIGKNFNKNCTVIFQSPVYNWKAVAEINQGFFHKEHLVVSTPKFKETELTDNVPVQIRIKSGEKICDPFEKEYVYERTIQKEVPENVEGKLRVLLLQDPALRRNLLEMFTNKTQGPTLSNDYDDIVAPIDMKTDLSENNDLIKPVPREQKVEKMDDTFGPVRSAPPFEFTHPPGMDYHTGSTIITELDPITNQEIQNQTPLPSPPCTSLNLTQSSPSASISPKPLNVSHRHLDYEEKIRIVDDSMEPALPDGFHPKSTGFTLPAESVFDQVPSQPVQSSSSGGGSGTMLPNSTFPSATLTQSFADKTPFADEPTPFADMQLKSSSSMLPTVQNVTTVSQPQQQTQIEDIWRESQNALYPTQQSDQTNLINTTAQPSNVPITHNTTDIIKQPPQTIEIDAINELFPESQSGYYRAGEIGDLMEMKDIKPHVTAPTHGPDQNGEMNLDQLKQQSAVYDNQRLADPTPQQLSPPFVTATQAESMLPVHPPTMGQKFVDDVSAVTGSYTNESYQMSEAQPIQDTDVVMKNTDDIMPMRKNEMTGEQIKLALENGCQVMSSNGCQVMKVEQSVENEWGMSNTNPAQFQAQSQIVQTFEQNQYVNQNDVTGNEPSY